MLGAGGLVAANWLANVAPQDGTVMLAISSNLPVGQAVGLDGVKYDIRKFSYIGNTTDSPNVINSWHTTGVTRIEQVMEKELVVGATGRSSGSYYYPAALNAFAGTKFKIVFGYPGGADVNIAMERGEVGGRGSNLWASWKSTRPQWLAEKKIHMLVQIALKRHPELPGRAADAGAREIRAAQAGDDVHFGRHRHRALDRHHARRAAGAAWRRCGRRSTPP